MANWTTEPQPFGPNRHPLLTGLSAFDGVTPVPVAVDPATGALQTAGGSTASSVAINDGTTTTRKATVLGLTDSNPLTVAIVNGTGDQITSFGGGTQYAEGATAATGTGTLAIWKDTSSGNTMRAASYAWPMPVDISNAGWPTGTGNVLLNIGNPTSIGELQSAAVANGNGTSTGSVQSDIATIVLQVVSSPSMSGGTTVNFEASVDGTNWFPVEGHKVGTAGSLQTTTTSDGIFVFDYAGLVGALGGSTGIRARISSYSAGTITVHAYGSIYPFNKNTVSLATGSNVIGGVTQSGTWNVSNAGTFAVQATLAAETTKVIGVTRTADGSGNLLTSTGNALDINIKSGNPTSITANAGTNLNTSALALETGGNLASVATNTTNVPNVIGTAASAIPSKLLQIGGSDGTNARAIKTNTSGQLDTRPLTSSDQITTVPSGTQTVSGTVTANAGTGSFTVAQATAASLNATVVGTGTFAVQAAESGTWNVGLSKTGTGYSVSSQTALTTTATVSGSSGKFGGAMFINLNSAPAYIQVFDTTGAVTLGSTTPTFVIPIPANSTAANGVGFVLPLEVGIAIANGIKVAATTTATGASTVATGLTGFIYYN